MMMAVMAMVMVIGDDDDDDESAYNFYTCLERGSHYHKEAVALTAAYWKQ